MSLSNFPKSSCWVGVAATRCHHGVIRLWTPLAAQSCLPSPTWTHVGGAGCVAAWRLWGAWHLLGRGGADGERRLCADTGCCSCRAWCWTQKAGRRRAWTPASGRRPGAPCRRPDCARHALFLLGSCQSPVCVFQSGAQADCDCCSTPSAHHFQALLLAQCQIRTCVSVVPVHSRPAPTA